MVTLILASTTFAGTPCQMTRLAISGFSRSVPQLLTYHSTVPELTLTRHLNRQNTNLYLPLHLYLYSLKCPIYLLLRGANIAGPGMNDQRRPAKLNAARPGGVCTNLQRILRPFWADPISRSTVGFLNLHHGTIRAQNWGIYFSDFARGVGLYCVPKSL